MYAAWTLAVASVAGSAFDKRGLESYPPGRVSGGRSWWDSVLARAMFLKGTSFYRFIVIARIHTVNFLVVAELSFVSKTSLVMFRLHILIFSTIRLWANHVYFSLLRLISIIFTSWALLAKVFINFEILVHVLFQIVLRTILLASCCNRSSLWF